MGTVFRPTRDRAVMIDDNGRLGEAPTPLLGSASRPDFDVNGYFLLDFMHDWLMEAPASFEPLPLSTWTSRAGKEHEIDFVLVPSAWHHLVQWNAVIPRVSLALRGQEPPLPFVHVTRNPQTAQQIQQFYDSVPVIPPECDANTAVELFSKLARVVLASFAPRFAPRPRRPWMRSQHGPLYNTFLKTDARVLPQFDDVAAAFFVWYSQLGTGTDRLIDYMPVTTISSVPSLTTVRPSQCGTSLTSVFLPGVPAGRITRPGFWRRRRRLRPFWSLVRALKGKRKRLVSRPVVDSAGVPATKQSRVAGLMGELFCTEFGHKVNIDSLDDHSLSSSRRERPCPFEVPSVADVQAALEPLTGLLKMGKATGPDFIPNEILRMAGQNFIAVFADLVVPESWRGGTMTPVPKQAKKPLGQDNARGVLLSSTLGKLHAKYLRSDATGHVGSAVLPAQLGGFPNKTIEFGKHLVNQRAAFYKRKGITSATIFLDMTAAFYRALPELVSGPLLDEKAGAVLLGAPSSCIEPSDYAWRIQAAILDWGLHSGSMGLLLLAHRHLLSCPPHGDLQAVIRGASG